MEDWRETIVKIFKKHEIEADCRSNLVELRFPDGTKVLFSREQVGGIDWFRVGVNGKYVHQG